MIWFFLRKLGDSVEDEGFLRLGVVAKLT